MPDIKEFGKIYLAGKMKCKRNEHGGTQKKDLKIKKIKK